MLVVGKCFFPLEIAAAMPQKFNIKMVSSCCRGSLMLPSTFTSVRPPAGVMLMVTCHKLEYNLLFYASN